MKSINVLLGLAAMFAIIGGASSQLPGYYRGTVCWNKLVSGTMVQYDCVQLGTYGCATYNDRNYVICVKDVAGWPAGTTGFLATPGAAKYPATWGIFAQVNSTYYHGYTAAWITCSPGNQAFVDVSYYVNQTLASVIIH